MASLSAFCFWVYSNVNQQLLKVAECLLQDAEPGLRSYGYITGIKAYGIFVSFLGGVKGLAHTAELPLAPDQTPKDAYLVGQVVKCRVLSTDFSHQRLKLSLMGKKSNAEGGEEGVETGDSMGGLQPGDVVEGRVREIEMAEVAFCAVSRRNQSVVASVAA